MSTVFPDLTGAQTAMERLMSDSVRIFRDSTGPDDITIDPLTGAETQGEPTTLYSGRALISYEHDRQSTEGGGFVVVRMFTVDIPAGTAKVPEVGDIVEVTASARDPHLKGTKLLVKDVEKTSLLVSRSLYCEEIADANFPRP